MTFLKILYAALALAFAAGAPAVAQMKPPVPMTPAQFAGASPGASVQIVVRVVTVDRSKVAAELLERKTDSDYVVTGKRVHLVCPDGVTFVMGGAGDIAPGAVLFVDGVATKPYRADVKKVVVLTKFITVEAR